MSNTLLMSSTMLAWVQVLVSLPKAVLTFHLNSWSRLVKSKCSWPSISFVIVGSSGVGAGGVTVGLLECNTSPSLPKFKSAWLGMPPCWI